MLLYFTIAIVVEALDLGTNPDNVWSIVLYAFRFAGIVALMGADLMAILAYFSKAEPTTGAILTTISLTLMRLGDVLNETPIIISEAIILGQM
jgi:hypothetical protein